MEIKEIKLPLYVKTVEPESVLKAHLERKEEIKQDIPITLHSDEKNLSIDPTKIVGSVKELKLEDNQVYGLCKIYEDSYNINSGKLTKMIEHGAPICILPHMLVHKNDDGTSDISKLIDFGVGIHNFADR